MIGYQELLIIFVLVLLFFGGRKIPEVARGLGKGMNEFKKAKDGLKGSLEDSPDDNDEQVAVAEVEAEEKAAKKDKKKKKHYHH